MSLLSLWKPEGSLFEILYSPPVIQYICLLNPLKKRNCPLAWPSMMCEILRTSNMHLNWIEYHHRDSASSPVLSFPSPALIDLPRHLVCNHNSMHKAYITRHRGNFHDFKQHSRLKTKAPWFKNSPQSQWRENVSVFIKACSRSDIENRFYIFNAGVICTKKVKHICQA